MIPFPPPNFLVPMYGSAPTDDMPHPRWLVILLVIVTLAAMASLIALLPGG
jgi:hypothetical protein